MAPASSSWKTLSLPSAVVITTLPSIYFFFVGRHHLSHHDRATTTKTLIWTYLLTGTLGITLAILLQTIISYLTALLCFGSHATALQYLSECMKQPPTDEEASKDKDESRNKLQRRREMAQNPRYWLFMLGFSLCGAAMVEEGIKYCAIMYAVTRSGERNGPAKHDYIAAAVAAGLGFATCENMAFVVSAALAGLKKEKDDGKRSLSTVTVLERVVVGTPGHTMTSVLTGVNMVAALHDAGQPSMSTTSLWWQVLLEPVLLHGFSDFGLFAISAWEGNVGWVHPKTGMAVCATLGVVVGLQGALALLLWVRLKESGLL